MNLVAESNHCPIRGIFLPLLTALVFILPQLGLMTSGKTPFMLPEQRSQALKAIRHPWWSASLVCGGH